MVRMGPSLQATLLKARRSSSDRVCMFAGCLLAGVETVEPFRVVDQYPLQERLIGYGCDEVFDQTPVRDFSIGRRVVGAGLLSLGRGMRPITSPHASIRSRPQQS